MQLDIHYLGTYSTPEIKVATQLARCRNKLGHKLWIYPSKTEISRY